jgi:hypothetical protein
MKGSKMRKDILQHIVARKMKREKRILHYSTAKTENNGLFQIPPRAPHRPPPCSLATTTYKAD